MKNLKEAFAMNDNKQCHFIIDMDTVLRTIYTELPKMRENNEKVRICYIHCKMYLADETKRKAIALNYRRKAK
jgi:hypothetical protein